MAAPMNAPLAPYFSLGAGYTVRFTALDATTGAEVAAVVISNATLSVDQAESQNFTLEPITEMPGPVLA
jgi:hypothetical protein